MDIRPGNHVWVNVAAFIASKRRHPESVLCVVIEVDGSQVQVQTQEPCRTFSMWVAQEWIDRLEQPALAGQN
jgi:hypothetical protein